MILYYINHMYHVIETDFEPDDAIAICAHASQSNNIELTVFVGESKPKNKIEIVEKFFENLVKKYPNAYSKLIILQGLSSTKKYPADESNYVPEQPDDMILENYKSMCANADVIYMMKPPREAMKLRLECSNTIVYCYGSFNWRTLKLHTKDFQDLMSRYKKFYYFDSFSAVGEKNSCIFKGIRDNVNNQIYDIITKWNNHIIADCKKDLMKKDIDDRSVERINKIISNVSMSVNEQFVMADVCLFLCPLPTERVELVDVNPYPKWIKSNESNIYTFDSDFESRRNDLIEKLSKL